MLPYTLDNCFKFGYGSGFFNPSDRSIAAPLHCEFARATREPLPFRAEVVEVARQLAAEAKLRGRKLFVLLSGGLDSEVVVKACLEAGIDFETITFRFKNRLNAHELQFVNRFVQRHKLKHRFYDIDIQNWINSDELHDLYFGSQAASMNLMPHMKLMSHVWFELNGLPVLGNGDMYLENDKGWKYVELEYMLSWYRHALRFGILGGIGFFQHTPEVILAMLRESKIERLGRNQDPYANKAYETSRFVKYGIYRKHWPDLEMRPKFGGQEMVKELYDEKNAELRAHQELWVDKWAIEYDDFRSLVEPNEEAFRTSAGLGPRQTAGQWLAGS